MKRHKLSPLDYVKVKPVRRGPRRLERDVTLKILTLIHWDLVVEKGRKVVKEALEQAREHGRWWGKSTPKGDGSLVDYCEFVVWAAKKDKVINDVEWKLWFSNPKDDPRLLEFRRGFLEGKREHEREKAEKKTKKRKRSG